MKYEDVKVGQFVSSFNNFEGSEHRYIVVFKDQTTGKILLLRWLTERNSKYNYDYFDYPKYAYASELSVTSAKPQYIKTIINSQEDLEFFKTNFYGVPSEVTEFPYYFVSKRFEPELDDVEFNKSINIQVKRDGNTMVVDQDAVPHLKIGTEYN